MSNSARLQIENFLLKYKINNKQIDKQTKWNLRQEWRKNFAVNVRDKTGKWIFKGIDWHAFSYSYTDSSQGMKAEEAYDNLKPKEFFLISSNDQVPSYECKTLSPPSAAEVRIFLSDNPDLFDMYISAPDFHWTIVFTHEQKHGLGPYFAFKSSENSE
jgi:Domain of unknown function (DUF4275)